MLMPQKREARSLTIALQAYEFCHILPLILTLSKFRASVCATKSAPGNMPSVIPKPLETEIDAIYAAAISATPDLSFPGDLVSALLSPARAFIWTRHPDACFRTADPFHRLGASVLRNKGLEVSLGVVRPSDGPGFSEFEVALFRAVVPHLRRAMAMQYELARAELRSQQARQALDRLVAAVVVLDGRGDILFANRRAEEMIALGEELTIEQSRLRAADEQQQFHLEDAIARVMLRGGKRPTTLGGSLLLLRRNTSGPLAVLVLPARQRFRWMTELSPAIVLIVIDPMRDETSEATLRELYGLTRAEAATLAVLSSGKGLPSAAARLNISPNTAKTHLARILDKTEAGGQVGLIHLIHGGLGLVTPN